METPQGIEAVLIKIENREDCGIYEYSEKFQGWIIAREIEYQRTSNRRPTANFSAKIADSTWIADFNLMVVLVKEAYDKFLHIKSVEKSEFELFTEQENSRKNFLIAETLINKIPLSNCEDNLKLLDDYYFNDKVDSTYIENEKVKSEIIKTLLPELKQNFTILIPSEYEEINHDLVLEFKSEKYYLNFSDQDESGLFLTTEKEFIEMPERVGTFFENEELNLCDYENRATLIKEEWPEKYDSKGTVSRKII